MTWDESKHPRGQEKNKGQFTKSREVPLDNRDGTYRLWAYNRGTERQVPLFPRQQKKDYRRWAENASSNDLYREAVGHAEFDRRRKAAKDEDGNVGNFDMFPGNGRERTTTAALGTDASSPIPNLSPTGAMSIRATRAFRREDDARMAAQRAAERALTAKRDSIVDNFHQSQRDVIDIMHRLNNDDSFVLSAAEMAIVEKADAALKKFVSTHNPIWQGEGRGPDAKWNAQMAAIYDQENPMSSSDVIEKAGYDKESARSKITHHTADYLAAVAHERNIARIRSRAAANEDDASEHRSTDESLTEFREHIADHRNTLIDEIDERKSEKKARREEKEQEKRDRKEEREREESSGSDDEEEHHRILESALTVPGLVHSRVSNSTSSYDGPEYELKMYADRDFYNDKGETIARKGELVSELVSRKFKEDGVIYNDYFKLKKNAQGQGIAAEVQNQAIETYRKNGLKEMTVYAFSNGHIATHDILKTNPKNGEAVRDEKGEFEYTHRAGDGVARDMNGGLTWAKLGFEWETPRDRLASLGRFKEYITNHHKVSDADAEVMIQKIQHPWDLAKVKINGRKAGESFLLTHQWHGRFDLDPESESSKYFAKYLEASRRKKMTKKDEAA